MPHEDLRPWIQKAKRRIERGKFDVSVDRIESLNAKMETAVAIDFKTGILGFRQKVPKKQLDEAFQAKDYRKIMRVIPWDKLQGSSDKAVGAMQEAFEGASGHAVTGVERQSNAELRWDASNPRTDKYYAGRKKQFMQDLKAGTRDNIQAVVQNANSKGLNSKMVADQIVGSIGLNNQQNNWLIAYENKLRGDGTPEKDIKKLVADRNDLLLEQRAKMIAVTETRNASAAGQQASWEAALDEGLIPESSRKEWVLGWEMACTVCTPMAGKQVPVREQWTVPNGAGKGKAKRVLTPPEIHPNCRCSATLVVGEEDDA